MSFYYLFITRNVQTLMKQILFLYLNTEYTIIKYFIAK